MVSTAPAPNRGRPKSWPLDTPGCVLLPVAARSTQPTIARYPPSELAVAEFGLALWLGAGGLVLLPLVTQEAVANFVENLAAMHPVLSKQCLALHAKFLQQAG